MKTFDIDILRSAVSYNPLTGLLVWKRCAIRPEWWNFKFEGKPAFSVLKPTGYLTGKIFGTHLLAHRAAWAISYGEWPAEYLDHINGDRSDNALSNLRSASAAENQWNKGAYRNNSSGFKGVYWHKPSQSWVARISCNNKIEWASGFKTGALAFEAYKEAAARLHGAFSKTT